LVNVTCTWAAAVAKPDLVFPSSQAEEIFVDNWVRKNLHDPIQAIIKNPE
jgi:hypothetical protein